jgi:hypothetical protein
MKGGSGAGWRPTADARAPTRGSSLARLCADLPFHSSTGNLSEGKRRSHVSTKKSAIADAELTDKRAILGSTREIHVLAHVPNQHASLKRRYLAPDSRLR